jgi:predicted ATPase
VGREQELAQLHERLEKAWRGERQLVFVTGEAGIGKTTLTDCFVQQIDASREVWIGQGQCVEHFGVGEAYLPILAALQHLGREPGRQRVVQVLRRHAPTWLAQLPGLASEDDRRALQRQTAGTTRERMLRELVDALEELTAAQSVV